MENQIVIFGPVASCGARGVRLSGFEKITVNLTGLLIFSQYGKTGKCRWIRRPVHVRKSRSPEAYTFTRKSVSLERDRAHLDIPIPPIFFGYNLVVHLTKGYFKHQIGPEVYTVQAPAVLISNYGNISAISSVDKLAQGHCVLINDNAMTALFREHEILNIFSVSPLLNLSVNENLDLEALLRQLFNEIRSKNPYRELSDSLLKSILLKVIKLSDANKKLRGDRKLRYALSNWYTKILRSRNTYLFTPIGSPYRRITWIDASPRCLKSPPKTLFWKCSLCMHNCYWSNPRKALQTSPTN